MHDGRRLNQIVSVIERTHGLTALDPSSRTLLGMILNQELEVQRTTAQELIEVSGMVHAVVYIKLNT